MSHIAKRASVVHCHPKRTKLSTKHMTLHPKCLQKGANSGNEEKKTSKKQNLTKIKTQAFVPKKISVKAHRTIVVISLKTKYFWMKKYQTNKFFRFRVMSRRYLRKLSSDSRNS